MRRDQKAILAHPLAAPPAPTKRCRVTDLPTMTCPKCKAITDDHDGFGVLHCEACGYCIHASITEGVCDLCGQAVQTPPSGA
jgi:hypothetical protein